VARGRGTRPPLVLVVDSLDDDREFFSCGLTGNGFRVATAASGTEALDVMLRVVPAPVLLDPVLPDLTVLDVVRTLRDDAGLGTSPLSRSPHRCRGTARTWP
jgi:two-component system, OmpR family, response regulator